MPCTTPTTLRRFSPTNIAKALGKPKLAAKSINSANKKLTTLCSIRSLSTLWLTNLRQ
jgi:hypothetical protein